MSGRLNSHPLNNNNNSNSNSNDNNDNDNNNNVMGTWLNKLNHILERFRHDNVKLVNINREIETALTDKNIEEGNNLIISKRGKRKDVFHLNDYIKALMVTEGKDPFTRENMKIGKLVRVRGGQRRNNYSNLQELINDKRNELNNNDINNAFAFVLTPIDFVYVFYQDFNQTLDSVLHTMTRFFLLANGRRDDVPLSTDIIYDLRMQNIFLVAYREKVLLAIRDNGLVFRGQNRFDIILLNLINKLGGIVGSAEPMMNYRDVMMITNYINTLHSIPLPRRD